MSLDIRQMISAALNPISESAALLVTHPMSQVQRYPVAFLQHYDIYTVDYLLRPVLFYVAFAPSRPTYLLTAQPENFIQMAKADGVIMNYLEGATDYAVAYLEVTRVTSRAFRIISQVEEIPWSQLQISEQKHIESVRNRYASIITAPTAHLQDAIYIVTIYTLCEQMLERHNITVAKNGTIRDECVLLEKDLPLSYEA